MIYSRLVSTELVMPRLHASVEVGMTDLGTFQVTGSAFSAEAQRVSAEYATLLATGTFEPYRGEVEQRHEWFRREIAPQLDRFIDEIRPAYFPMYILHIGIGANEQHMRGFAMLLNRVAGDRDHRIIVARDVGEYLAYMAAHPGQLHAGNTVVVAISRSGDTQETVATLEEAAPEFQHFVVLTNPPQAAATKGLYTVAQSLQDSDGKHMLVLPVSRGIGGRNQRRHDLKDRVTLYLARGAEFVDTLWGEIDAFDRALSTGRGLESLAVQLVAFILANQKTSGRNILALVCDDETYYLAMELRQFLMEGANRFGVNQMRTDIHMLPRDSHSTVEGALANRGSSLAFFILSDRPKGLMGEKKLKSGLTVNENIFALNSGNLARFQEAMPTAWINLRGQTSLSSWNAASTLIEDMGGLYPIAWGINPYGNPEVSEVRRRGAALIAQALARKG